MKSKVNKIYNLRKKKKISRIIIIIIINQSHKAKMID